MDVSVIIAAHNEEGYIEKPLSSLLKQKFDGSFEIIIVDDESEDKTCKIVEDFSKKHEKVKLIKMSTRSGVAKASNKGVKHAQGHVVAFLDADCSVPENWLQTLWDGMSKGYVAIVGPNSLKSYKNYSEKFYFQHSFDIMGKILNTTQLPVCPLRSNSAFLKREFESIGGYKDVAAEDMEIGFKVRKSGKVHYNSKMQIHASTRRLSKHGILKTSGKNILAYVRVVCHRPEKGLGGSYFRDSTR